MYEAQTRTFIYTLYPCAKGAGVPVPGGYRRTCAGFLVPGGWGVPCASSTGPEPLHIPRSLRPPSCQAMRQTKAQKPEGNAQTCSPSFPGTARSSRGAIEAKEQSGGPSSRTARKQPRSSQGAAMEQPGRPGSSQGAARSSRGAPRAGSQQPVAKLTIRYLPDIYKITTR